MNLNNKKDWHFSQNIITIQNEYGIVAHIHKDNVSQYIPKAIQQSYLIKTISKHDIEYLKQNPSHIDLIEELLIQNTSI